MKNNKTHKRVIAIAQHKGGVGKTTTTINLGYALAMKGYEVLLIDLDAQANLTESLGIAPGTPGIVEAFSSDGAVTPIMKGSLDVLPSSLDPPVS